MNEISPFHYAGKYRALLPILGAIGSLNVIVAFCCCTNKKDKLERFFFLIFFIGMLRIMFGYVLSGVQKNTPLTGKNMLLLRITEYSIAL